MNGVLRTEILDRAGAGANTNNKKLQSISSIYLDVNSIVNAKNDNRMVCGDGDEEEFTEDDEKLIQNLAA
jgi:hypothetical protein